MAVGKILMRAFQVAHVQLPSCPNHIVFRICSTTSPCLSFTFSVLQPQPSPEGAQVFILGDSQRGQGVFEQHLAALSSMRPQPRLLLHLGDTAQRAYIDGDWDQRFFGPLKRSKLMLPMLLVQGNHDLFTEANASSADISAGAQPVSSYMTEGSVMVNPSLLSYQGTAVRLPTYFATSIAGVRWIVLDTNLRSRTQLQVSRLLRRVQKCSYQCGSGCKPSFKVRLPFQPIFAWCACTYRHGSSFGNRNRGAIAIPTALATRPTRYMCVLTYCQ